MVLTVPVPSKLVTNSFSRPDGSLTYRRSKDAELNCEVPWRFIIGKTRLSSGNKWDLLCWIEYIYVCVSVSAICESQTLTKIMSISNERYMPPVGQNMYVKSHDITNQRFYFATQEELTNLSPNTSGAGRHSKEPPPSQCYSKVPLILIAKFKVSPILDDRSIDSINDMVYIYIYILSLWITNNKEYPPPRYARSS